MSLWTGLGLEQNFQSGWALLDDVPNLVDVEGSPNTVSD